MSFVILELFTDPSFIYLYIYLVNVEAVGVKPSRKSISNIPRALQGWHRRTLSGKNEVWKRSVFHY